MRSSAARKLDPVALPLLISYMVLCSRGCLVVLPYATPNLFQNLLSAVHDPLN